MTEPTIKSFIAYMADWCGHCTVLKDGAWYKFKYLYSIFAKQLYDKYNICLKICEYDSDKDSEIVNEARVSGFPTIKIICNQQSEDYDKPRTIDAFLLTLFPDIKDDKLLSEIVNTEVPPDHKRIEGSLSFDSNGLNISNSGQSGGTLLFSSSYKKYMKYRNKCLKLNLIRPEDFLI